MDIAINILSFIGGMLGLYLTAYVKVKGKNKALIEDLKSLEDEKQRVIAKYRAETEEVKKQHILDIEKRKFQYEDKRKQFTKYFALLDEFHKKSNTVFIEKFQPILSEFLSGYLVENEAEKKIAFDKYNESVQALVFEINEEQIKLNSEQNSIRLIASQEVDELLDRLGGAVKTATEFSGDMLRFMATPEFLVDQSLISPFQEKLAVIGSEVQEFHSKLKEQMKTELNEI